MRKADGSCTRRSATAAATHWFFIRLAMTSATICALAVMLTSSTDSSAGVELAGDNNCDQVVDTVDALALIHELAGGPSLDCPAGADVNCDGDRDAEDVRLVLRYAGDLSSNVPAGCAHIGTPIGSGGPQPLSILFDEQLAPQQPSIEGIDGGPARELATVSDEYGNKADFVLNEIIVATNNPGDLAAYLQQVNGQVLASIDGGGLWVDTHLISIDPALPDPGELADSIRERSNTLTSEITIKDTVSLPTLAASVIDPGPGVDVGMNWVLHGDTLRERTTTEASSGPGAFTSDAYLWSYLNTGSEQDIGVTEAWTALAKTDRLDNKSALAVIDSGFAPDDDFPDIDAHLGAPPNRAGALMCSGGSACPWHGTNVVHAAMGVPDNGYGAAGPGGPVSSTITFHRRGDIFETIEALADVQSEGADIVNMSFSGDVPAALSFTVAPYNIATGSLAASGTLLFASSGNDGINVDAEDCFGICWEESWTTPCENAGVICVGALDPNSRFAALYSNYGAEDVEIFAPGTVFVGPDLATSGVQSVSGTSFASPFTAGVAALVWAANPSLSSEAVIGLLLGNAHPSPHSKVPRYVNAWGAVKAALGGNTPPNLDIVGPASGASFSRGSELASFSALASDAEDGTPTVTWTSDLDGVIGTGVLVQRNNMSVGTHTITASVTDSGGFTDFETITVEIVNDPPVVEITQPAHGAEFFQGQTIHLAATSLDTNAIPQAPLPDSDIRWFLAGVSEIATGHDATIPGGTLPLGNNTIYAWAYEGDLLSSDSITVTIHPDPADLPPDVVITSPENGSTFLANQSDAGGDYRVVPFAGLANDPEDGPLPGSSMQWHYREGTSGIFQPVGTGEGRNIKLYALDCFGTTYQVRLTGIDSASNISTYTITVTITSLC